MVELYDPTIPVPEIAWYCNTGSYWVVLGRTGSYCFIVDHTSSASSSASSCMILISLVVKGPLSLLEEITVPHVSRRTLAALAGMVPKDCSLGFCMYFSKLQNILAFPDFYRSKVPSAAFPTSRDASSSASSCRKSRQQIHRKAPPEPNPTRSRNNGQSHSSSHNNILVSILWSYVLLSCCDKTLVWRNISLLRSNRREHSTMLHIAVSCCFRIFASGHSLDRFVSDRLILLLKLIALL